MSISISSHSSNAGNVIRSLTRSLVKSSDPAPINVNFFNAVLPPLFFRTYFHKAIIYQSFSPGSHLSLVIQAPFVKSGIPTGIPPALILCSERGVIAIMAAES